MRKDYGKTSVRLRLDEAFSWVNVDAGGVERRLFTAVVHRWKATYNFTNRAFFRGIVQYIRQDRNPDLYVQQGLPKEDAALSSSLLLAYKLNWQSVVFLGYGDNQALNDQYELARHDRQLFLKISYAFQR